MDKISREIIRSLVDDTIKRFEAELRDLLLPSLIEEGELTREVQNFREKIIGAI